VNDVVIRAQGLGKKYMIGHEIEAERYTALRDVVARRTMALLRTTTDMLRGRAIVAGATTEEIWALKDVDFDVKRGEVLGVVGRNGAGKSTLLKILSRITEPSAGEVAISGRVASLLEVGTGFHPELTGRENIYLNGAILGMTRAEIRRKFDEIIAFAEVEKFLDTPVKRFSSGMYVRLAFAVAAHLEPEILVVDEILAVGDAEFQQKCLGKMQDVASHGRTVLFVSHNMAAVARLCGRCLLLDNGGLVADGAPGPIISRYIQGSGAERSETQWQAEASAQQAMADLNLLKVEVLGERSHGPTFQPDEQIEIVLTYRQNKKLIGPRLVVQLETANGEIAFTVTDHAVRGSGHQAPGIYTSAFTIPAGLLNRTRYLLRIWAGIPGQQKLIEATDILWFNIAGVGNEGSLFYDPAWPGAVCPRVEWSIKPVESEMASAGVG
jgi:lipopolysaccharide transport system ATP-binding protein